MNDNTIEIKDDSGILFHIGFLQEHLTKIPDKSCARGKRYSLAILLLVIILAKLSGENTPTGISEWRTMSENLEDDDLQQHTRQYLHQIYGG